MRILVRFKSLKDCAYDKKYYSEVRGFLYSLQKDSKYFNRHDNTGYKFYSFSNLIPPVNMKEGDIRTLIVASLDIDFIRWIYGRISEMAHSIMPVNIGEMQFGIESVSFLKAFIDDNTTLVKKYNQYYGKKIPLTNLFENFEFKKPVCVHRIEDGVEIKTVGSLWKFRFSHLEPEQKRILRLGLESGLGELNSSGFGFMNMVR